MNKLAIGLMVVAACGGGKDGGGAGAAPNMPAELAGWMPKGAIDAWQGAWTTRMNLGTKIQMTSPIVAVDIKGEGAKAFDGTAEHAIGFQLESPCTAGFKIPITDGAMKGGTSTVTKYFMIKDGKVLAGEGAVGIRKGKAAVACTIGMGGLTTVDDAGKCKSWSNMLSWSSKDQTCAWSNEGGKDVLTIGTGTWSTKLVADGDFLVSDQFNDEVKKEATKKHASYDDAKKAVADAAAKK